MGPTGPVPQLLKMMGPRVSGPTNFGYWTLRKIITFVATKRQILGLNAPNSIYAGVPPQTPLGELTALP